MGEGQRPLKTRGKRVATSIKLVTLYSKMRKRKRGQGTITLKRQAGKELPGRERLKEKVITSQDQKKR